MFGSRFPPLAGQRPRSLPLRQGRAAVSRQPRRSPQGSIGRASAPRAARRSRERQKGPRNVLRGEEARKTASRSAWRGLLRGRRCGRALTGTLGEGSVNGKRGAALRKPGKPHSRRAGSARRGHCSQGPCGERQPQRPLAGRLGVRGEETRTCRVGLLPSQRGSQKVSAIPRGL